MRVFKLQTFKSLSVKNFQQLLEIFNFRKQMNEAIPVVTYQTTATSLSDLAKVCPEDLVIVSLNWFYGLP